MKPSPARILAREQIVLALLGPYPTLPAPRARAIAALALGIADPLSSAETLEATLAALVPRPETPGARTGGRRVS